MPALGILSSRLLILLALAVAFQGCTVHTDRYEGPDKVTLCHKGKNTIAVAPAAVDAHLNHGDHKGRCC